MLYIYIYIHVAEDKFVIFLYNNKRIDYKRRLISIMKNLQQNK